MGTISSKQFQSIYDYRDAFTVIPSDTVALATDANNTVGYTFANALLVLTAGNVSFITPNGKTISLVAVPVGTIIKVAAAQVKATGTSSSVAALIR